MLADISANRLVELNLVEGDVPFDVKAVSHLIRSSVTEIAVVTTINAHLKNCLQRLVLVIKYKN